MTYRRVINRKRLPNRVSKVFHTKHASTFKRLKSFPKHNTHMGAQPGELGSLALSKLKFLIYYDLPGKKKWRGGGGGCYAKQNSRLSTPSTQEEVDLGRDGGKIWRRDMNPIWMTIREWASFQSRFGGWGVGEKLWVKRKRFAKIKQVFFFLSFWRQKRGVFLQFFTRGVRSSPFAALNSTILSTFC